MKRILAVDQSYRSSGIIILQDGQIAHCEKYASDEDKDIYDRAGQVALHIQLLAAKWLPDVIVLEGLSFGSKGNVTRDLGGLMFTIMTSLRRDGFKPEVIPPTTVKKFATGKGNSKKGVLIDILPTDVRELFDSMNLKKSTGLSDLTDAYWIGKYAENNL